jgi:uncharacterized SAM-binding protein YcdF (DUF218 family)
MISLIIGILVIAVIIISLGIYLAPNDLAGCGRGPTGEGKCKKVDAIIAVSGGDTPARTNEAVRLYQQGWASSLIFSGAAQDKSGPSNAAVMREEAVAAGVPASAIMIEEQGETTKQNADKTQQLLEEENINTVILVTSAYHQRRAGLEFSERSAGKVTVINHPVASDKQWSAWWWLTPGGWYLAVGEFIKIMMFYVGVTR